MKILMKREITTKMVRHCLEIVTKNKAEGDIRERMPRELTERKRKLYRVFLVKIGTFVKNCQNLHKSYT